MAQCGRHLFAPWPVRKQCPAEARALHAARHGSDFPSAVPCCGMVLPFGLAGPCCRQAISTHTIGTERGARRHPPADWGSCVPSCGETGRRQGKGKESGVQGQSLPPAFPNPQFLAAAWPVGERNGAVQEAATACHRCSACCHRVAVGVGARAGRCGASATLHCPAGTLANALVQLLCIAILARENREV